MNMMNNCLLLCSLNACTDNSNNHHYYSFLYHNIMLSYTIHNTYLNEHCSIIIMGKSNILQLRDLKNVMASIDNGFKTISTITSITKYIPKIGTVIAQLQRTINLGKSAFSSAYTRVKLIDSKVYKYKDDCDNGAKKCATGKNIAADRVESR